MLVSHNNFQETRHVSIFISQSMEIESGCPMSLVIQRSEDKAFSMDNVFNYYYFLFLEICLVDKSLQVG